MLNNIGIEMKKLMIAVLLCFSTFAQAGDAIFTWLKPVPPFPVGADPTLIIDEYHINCTVDGISPFQKIVPGYDTQTASYTDIPEGLVSCSMTSFSILGGESIASNIVAKQVFQVTGPNPPNSFSF